jgi:hypothetical protein
MMPNNHFCAPHIWISLSLDHLQFVTYLLSCCAHVCPNFSNIFKFVCTVCTQINAFLCVCVCEWYWYYLWSYSEHSRNMLSEAFMAVDFDTTLYSSLMTRTDTLLKMLVYSPFNHVVLHLAQDVTHRMGYIGMLFLFTNPACVCSRLKRWHNFYVLIGSTYFF